MLEMILVLNATMLLVNTTLLLSIGYFTLRSVTKNERI